MARRAPQTDEVFCEGAVAARRWFETNNGAAHRKLDELEATRIAGGQPIDVPGDRRILTNDELRTLLADGDYEEQFHQYAGGGYHTHVMAEGAFCRGCDERLETMTIRLPFRNEVTRHFPFRVQHSLVQQGGTHRCGGKIAFEISYGPEGGPISIVP